MSSTPLGSGSISLFKNENMKKFSISKFCECMCNITYVFLSKYDCEESMRSSNKKLHLLWKGADHS